MPPLYWLPLAVVGLVVFVWLWDSAPTARIAALLRGWAWGVGHFAVGSYWMVEAFFVPPADFAPLGPPAVIGLAFVLGILPGDGGMGDQDAGAALAASRRPLSPARPAGRSPGRPQNGYAATSSPAIRGIRSAMSGRSPRPCCRGAALVGVYGLGTLTFIVLAAPAAGWRASLAALAGRRRGRRRRASGDGAGRRDHHRAAHPHRAAQYPAGREMAAREPRAPS